MMIALWIPTKKQYRYISVKRWTGRALLLLLLVSLLTGRVKFTLKLKNFPISDKPKKKNVYRVMNESFHSIISV